MTVEFAGDLECVFFCSGKCRPSYVCDHNWCISAKSILGWNAAVFWACKVIRLLPIVFCVVRTVHKFHFWLVIKERRDEWQLVERRSCSGRDLCIYRVHMLFVGWDNAVGVGRVFRRSNPGGGEIFRPRPDRPWGTTQPAIQWVPVLFPDSKTAEARLWPTTPGPRLKKG